jgi:hypothetical protein
VGQSYIGRYTAAFNHIAGQMTEWQQRYTTLLATPSPEALDAFTERITDKPPSEYSTFEYRAEPDGTLTPLYRVAPERTRPEESE